jgi:hypothetical protein
MLLDLAHNAAKPESDDANHKDLKDLKVQGAFEVFAVCIFFLG